MLTKTYTIEEKTSEMLTAIRKEKGIPSSWIVNRAVQEYVKKNKLLEE